MPTSAELFAAIRRGDPSGIERLLELDPALARARDEAGTSALLAACYQRRPELAAALRPHAGLLDPLEAAALGDAERLAELCAADTRAADRRSPDGFTPLQLAAFFARPACARVLLERGADLEAVSENAMSLRAVHAAAAGGSAEILGLLLEQGAEPTSRQAGGWTPLHAAAGAGREDLARLLLDRGADPAAANDAGETPADTARSRGHGDLAQLLERPQP